jgi:hypothetical protein
MRELNSLGLDVIMKEAVVADVKDEGEDQGTKEAGQEMASASGAAMVADDTTNIIDTNDEEPADADLQDGAADAEDALVDAENIAESAITEQGEPA